MATGRATSWRTRTRHASRDVAQVEEAARPIKYLPEKAQDSRIDNTAEDTTIPSRLELAWTSPAQSRGGIHRLTRAHRRNELQKRLVATGSYDSGRVTSIDSERAGKRTVLFLRFEFTTTRAASSKRARLRSPPGRNVSGFQATRSRSTSTGTIRAFLR